MTARGLKIALFLAGLAVPVMAQPAIPGNATESVTVTGTRSHQVIEKFVESFAAPTRMTGKLARWQVGICPVAVGLKPVFTQFIAQRLRDIAAKAGVPVNNRADCKSNIEIVFTTTPQALIDNVRKQNEAYLGYADNTDAVDALAKVTRPIQAWYLTATMDLRGNTLVDSAKALPTEIILPDPYHNPPFITVYSKQGAMSVTGTRLGDGLRSGLYHIIIVADPTKLVEYEMGTVGDYIAMLALAQLSSLDTCQTLPSIVNLLAAGCANKALALTENDAAYLRGLYHMGPDRNLRSQEDDVTYQMDQMFQGH
jgi:hypothetical protein